MKTRDEMIYDFMVLLKSKITLKRSQKRWLTKCWEFNYGLQRT